MSKQHITIQDLDAICIHCNTTLKIVFGDVIGTYCVCASTQDKDRCLQYYIEQQHKT